MAAIAQAAAAISEAILEGGEHAVTLARSRGSAKVPASHQRRTVLAAVKAAARRLRRWRSPVNLGQP